MIIDLRRRHRLRTVALAAVVVAGTASSAWVASPAVASAPQSWVALGDSYTAGAVPAAGDEFEYPRDGCGRTDRSYPEMIQRELGSLVELTNVSCGNATVSSITQPQTPIGHHAPPLSNDPDYPFEEVPPQLDAVRSSTDIVTVGIGGNTLGFGQLMTDCVALGGDANGDGTPCENEYGESIQARLDNLADEYAAMLSAIHNKAPHARVVTVGYPHIVPENVSLCRYGNLLEFYTITPGDLTWLRREVLEGLNRVIENLSHQYGDTFADLYPSTVGHSVCDKAGGNNWVDGLYTSLIPLRPALVHPNVKGHANAAQQVEMAILS